MPARVPQDVDLEDKLVFGLSPLRFGYVVIGMVLAAAVWAAHWPGPLPAIAVLPIAAGAILALGRWRPAGTKPPDSNCYRAMSLRSPGTTSSCARSPQPSSWRRPAWSCSS